MNSLSISLAMIFNTAIALAQNPLVSATPDTTLTSLAIDLSNPDLSVQTGRLKVGGTNPQGVKINANSRYLTLGGKPWYPIMGEFHYSRYPREQWEEELLKMKAGGINVVSTYVFWIYQEEEEGKWNWSGNRDLRAFVQLCQKHGLYCYPRIGPWAHGEVRNGGFPDWLLQKCGKEVRKNAEPYLSYVREFYEQIGQQLAGLLWKDGGPVIGTQIENEMTNNPAHLLTLKNLAREVGIEVPLYTVTGWMRAHLPDDEMLPVFGGYPDAFWSRQTEGWARESRVNYFFSHDRDDSTIGADLAKTNADRPNETMQRFPYGTVELGGGMQVSYRRRPAIEADDVAALALVKIGSGSNMQGYYMYHGGANALGELSTLQESRATGYPNDMPVINYDFQAPLGEYGQHRPSYDALRVEHLFLQDFGSDLSPMPMTLPKVQPCGMDDQGTLRWSARSDGKRGFLFINNYQRIESLPEHNDVQFELILKDNETLRIPADPVRIPAQSYMIWPFNMDLVGVRLKYATAQPLCRIGGTFVFFTDSDESEFMFDMAGTAGKDTSGKTSVSMMFNRLKMKPSLQPVKVPIASGSSVKILLLNAKQALGARKTNMWGKERLFISDAGLVFDDKVLRVQSRDPAKLTFTVYPPTKGLKQNDGEGDDESNGVFESFKGNAEPEQIQIEWKQTKSAAPATPAKLDEKGIPLSPTDADFNERSGVWRVSLPADSFKSKNIHRVFLRVDYEGDVGRAYIEDRMIDDDFYFGRVWEIGLNRFLPKIAEEGLTLRILPLRKDAPIYIPKARLPDFGDKGEALQVRSITAEAEYEITVREK